jgi:predicted MFS family arabinose efflux permease
MLRTTKTLKISEIHTSSLLGIFTLARLIASTAFRMVYPFLPAMARGLGVPIEAVAAAVSARSALGFLGPVLGAVADWRGRKKALLIALVVFSLSLVMVGIWPTYEIFFLGLCISGGAAVVIDSSIHAYLGDKIPYERRGRATAIVELGWSLAFVIGIPLVGWSMSRSGWNTPFIWLGLAGLVAGTLIGIFVPHLPPSAGSISELRTSLRQIFHHTTLMGLLLAVLIVLANQVISIVFGVWMEDSFGLKLEQLGAASSVIGMAGVAGVVCALWFTDRLGKTLAIGLGLGINSLICLALPLVGGNLWGALIVLFFLFLSFEFTLTSLLPLMTALATQARGAFMAATLAAFSLGDSLGALIGPELIRSGLVANAFAAVVFNLVGLILLVVFIRPVENREAKLQAATEQQAPQFE